MTPGEFFKEFGRRVKSLGVPIFVIVLAGALVWLKQIQSSFLWTCMELLEGTQTPRFERCWHAAHQFMWTIDVTVILLLIFVIWIGIAKRWRWWIKILTALAWLAALFYTMDPD